MEFNIDGNCDNCEAETKLSEVYSELGDDKNRQKICEYCFNLDDADSSISKDMVRMFIVLESKLNNYKDLKGLVSDNEGLKLKIRSHLTLLGDIQIEVREHAEKGFSKKDNELNRVYKLVEKGLQI